MRLETSTEIDLPQIKDWWLADEDHKHKPLPDDFFLTGFGLLTFRLDDSTGPTMYVRCEQDAQERIVRMHIQFNPEALGARVAKSIYKTLPVVIQHFKDQGFVAMVFDSVTPALTNFLKRFDFQPVSGTNDFKLDFYPPELFTINASDGSDIPVTLVN